MSYKRQSFTDGKKLYARNLNHIEDGIVAAHEEIDGIKQNGTGTGLTATASALLIAILKNCYTSSNQDANIQALEEELTGSSGGGDTPSDPTTPTLTSISAVANETTVTVGTKAEDLDITVTAHYSDGTTATITDYSISGTVGAGENTFTIVYGGKTTTVTVTGSALVYSLYNKDMNEGEVDFGVEMNELKSFTVKLDITMNTVISNSKIFEWKPKSSNTYAAWWYVIERSGNSANGLLMSSDTTYAIAGNEGYTSNAGDRHQFVATYNFDDDSCAIYFAETPDGGTMVQKSSTGTVDKSLFDGILNTGTFGNTHRILQGDYTVNACEISFEHTSAENAAAWFEREV